MSRPLSEITQNSIMNQSDQQPKLTDGAERAASQDQGNEEPIASLRSVRIQVEIKAIMAALQRTGWNRKQAARLLKISYRGLLYKIRQHNITAA
jgi:DNA-binding NtrC family response regulator